MKLFEAVFLSGRKKGKEKKAKKIPPKTLLPASYPSLFRPNYAGKEKERGEEGDVQERVIWCKSQQTSILMVEAASDSKPRGGG